MVLSQLTVWAAHDSPRLRYVLDWLFRERLGINYTLVTNKLEAAAALHCVAYGFLENCLSIHESPLLWQTNICEHSIVRDEWQGLHGFYFDAASACTIPFDLLGGIFYLLSRYEEYFGFETDRHNRYPATQSILFKDGVLERPIVDEWVAALRVLLMEKWGLEISVKPFSYQATYDIDIAWSYKNKGWKRNVGGAFVDLYFGKWKELICRIKVLLHQQQDPYDSFDWLHDLHRRNKLSPIWFFLVALESSDFDKNCSPVHPAMVNLIANCNNDLGIGMHPSYYSDLKPKKLLDERAALESILKKNISISRQHFIRLRLPKTYQTLIDAGILDDYSMGYSTHLGFRAATGSSFLWYDLNHEKTTNLRVHPFVFMDTTARFDMGLSLSEAYKRLVNISNQLQRLQGTLITVMHNFSLGSDAGWEGWREAYDAFVEKMQNS